MREEYLTRASLPPSLPSSRSTTPIQRACCLVSLVYPRRNSTKSRQTCPTLMPPLFNLISLKASGSLALENRRRMSHEDRLKFCQRCSGTIGFLHDKSRIGKHRRIIVLFDDLSEVRRGTIRMDYMEFQKNSLSLIASN